MFQVNLLRKNADRRVETMYGIRKSGADGCESDVQIAGHSGHVNFFADLEAEDRKNLGAGNCEYELEKRREREDYEKKVGILQYLGQGSSELTKVCLHFSSNVCTVLCRVYFEALREPTIV